MVATQLRYIRRGVLAVVGAAFLVLPASAYAVGPYFEATGGDTVAGAKMAAPTSPCGVPIATAGIVSWNADGSPDYGGAGSQYAAFAMNYVQDFVTGKSNAPNPNDLTFANVNYSGSVNLGGGLFGGMFGDTPCADYWNNKPPTTALPATTVDAGSLSGAYLHSGGNLTLTGTTIAAGQHVTIYVDGDVAITGNITYATGGWTDRTQIPSFKLIVHGVIYIDKGVTALDGLYAAIPDAGYDNTSKPSNKQQFSAPKAGTISTCSTGFNSYDPTLILTTYASMPADCAKRLVVTGSVVAGQVWMLRNIGAPGGQSAETFNYAPEVWLAPAGGSGGASSGSMYQSVIGLPPIL